MQPNGDFGEEWGRIIGRDVKWKMAYSTVLKEKGQERGMDFPSHQHFEKQIEKTAERSSEDRVSRRHGSAQSPALNPKDQRGNPPFRVRPGNEKCLNRTA